MRDYTPSGVESNMKADHRLNRYAAAGGFAFGFPFRYALAKKINLQSVATATATTKLTAAVFRFGWANEKLAIINVVSPTNAAIKLSCGRLAASRPIVNTKLIPSSGIAIPKILVIAFFPPKCSSKYNAYFLLKNSSVSGSPQNHKQPAKTANTDNVNRPYLDRIRIKPDQLWLTYSCAARGARILLMPSSNGLASITIVKHAKNTPAADASIL